MARRRSWDGLESIEPGDRIRFETPSGVAVECIVAKPLAIITTPTTNKALRFYSEMVRHREAEFTAFERVVSEDWITHWRRKRVRSSSARTVNTLTSSVRRVADGNQSILPIQEGA